MALRAVVLMVLCSLAARGHASGPVRITKTCFSSGEVCSGPNKSVSNGLPCCDGFTCTGSDPVRGLTCVKGGPQCHPEFAFCIPGSGSSTELPCCKGLTCVPVPQWIASCRNLSRTAATTPVPSSKPHRSDTTCYAAGERCIGAKDFPFVPYKPCCGDLTCSGKGPEYGRACEKPKLRAFPKCYASGQRCVGAPNHPYVPYLPCCDGMACTAKDPKYGLSCERPQVKAPIPAPELNCYAAGERCIGWDGFPAVPYKSCCGDMTCSARDPVYGHACELPATVRRL
jgi:hypothetical protein